MILGENQQFASPAEALAHASAISEEIQVVDHRTKPGLPSDILEHYGVKGMRWGVRKKEELVGRDSGTQEKPALSEKRQRRVDKFLKRADVMDTKISDLKLENVGYEGTRNPVKLYSRYANNQAIRNYEQVRDRSLRDAEAVSKGKLTSTQKQVIVGAVAVGALVAAAAVYRGKQSGALNSYKLLAQARLQGQSTPFAKNPKLSRPMSVSDLLNQVAKPVNPNYSTPGGQMNCRRSTYAYELRRRGFDVHATTSSAGWGQSESGVINALTPGSRNFYRSTSVSSAVVEALEKGRNLTGGGRGEARTAPGLRTVLTGLGKMNAEGTLTSSSQRVLEELAKQPNGARGEVLFKFSSFGHSMAYEVVNGVPHIFDSQKGQLYNSATKMVESKWDGFHAAEIRRLDNVDLDLNFLSRWATNVGGK